MKTEKARDDARSALASPHDVSVGMGINVRFDDLHLLLSQRVEPFLTCAGANDCADRRASLP
jgi:hypothetical protein